MAAFSLVLAIVLAFRMVIKKKVLWVNIVWGVLMLGFASVLLFVPGAQRLFLAFGAIAVAYGAAIYHPSIGGLKARRHYL